MTRHGLPESVRNMTVIAVTEFKGCKDGRKIQERDSLIFATDKRIHTAVWAVSGVKNAKCSADVFYNPSTHPETGEKEELRIRNWYICGKKNAYLVSYATTSVSAWSKWLPEMEKLVASLREL